MADVQAILSEIDSGLEQYLPVIAEIQDDYYSENGRYAQGLFTHSSVPVDENREAPDQLGGSPTDQDETWQDLADGVIPSTMLSRMRIDTYRSTKGHGYVIVLEKIINDETYQRWHNVGPETDKSRDWVVIIEEDL